jgi:curved DNA-binding protein CbpA
MPVQTPNLRTALAHLGLSWPVAESELRGAYRRLAFTHHPDRGGSHAEFVRVQGAYEAVLAAVRAGVGSDSQQRRPGPGSGPEARGSRQRPGPGPGDPDAFRAFVSGFGRSRRGNLWRMWRGHHITVHTGKRGGWSYCIGSDDEGPRFAGRWFDSEEEAMRGLWQAVREEDW